MIVCADEKNIDRLVELGLKFWPDNDYSDLKKEFLHALVASDQANFLYKDQANNYIGFMQLSVRDHYVEGCESSPVAYLEGIFVEDHSRRGGIAQEMVRFAEDWGREKGCKELGSDCELDNTLSIDFHNGVGFTEANRLVCFIKNIVD